MVLGTWEDMQFVVGVYLGIGYTVCGSVECR